MWQAVTDVTSNEKLISSPPISINTSKILIGCSVADRPTWNFAGNCFISSNDISPISLQRQKLYLGIPELIIINPEIIELLDIHYFIYFEIVTTVAMKQR